MVRLRPSCALCSLGYRFHQSSRCGKETQTFGANGNGVASIVRVMKTGSTWAKSDLLRERELRKWSRHAFNRFIHIGIAASYCRRTTATSSDRRTLLLAPMSADVLGKPLSTDRCQTRRSHRDKTVQGAATRYAVITDLRRKSTLAG